MHFGCVSRVNGGAATQWPVPSADAGDRRSMRCGMGFWLARAAGRRPCKVINSPSDGTERAVGDALPLTL
ncbi:hypothetical protein QFZ76_009354 [Streptomyces sp. V4I2]|nr:hypothetical protein [Streptomyces sp. V4I2]